MGVIGSIGVSGKNPSSRGKPRSCHAICFGGQSALAQSWQNAPADVLSVAHARLVRGAEARRSGFGFPLNFFHKILLPQFTKSL